MYTCPHCRGISLRGKLLSTPAVAAGCRLCQGRSYRAPTLPGAPLLAGVLLFLGLVGLGVWQQSVAWAGIGLLMLPLGGAMAWQRAAMLPVAHGTEARLLPEAVEWGLSVLLAWWTLR